MGYYDRDDDSYTRTRDSSERSSNWRNESIFGRSNRRDDDGDWRTRRSTRGGSGNRNYQSRGSGDEGYGPDDDRDDLPRNETNHLIASNKVEGTAVYGRDRSEEHTSELQSLMRTSYAVFCLQKTTTTNKHSQLQVT